MGEIETSSKEHSNFDEIFEEIGVNGQFQKRFNIIIVILTMLLSMQFMTKIITVTVPDHWCHVPGRNKTNYSQEEWKNITIPKIYINGNEKYSKCTRFMSSFDQNETVKCDNGWEYDHTWYDMTAPMQNNWVCDNNMIPTHVLAINRGADLLGTIIFGHLGDYFGRQPTFYIALICLLIGRIAIVFTSSWVYLFMFFTFVGSFTNNTVALSTYIIAFEICGAKSRAFISMITGYGWGVGVIIAPLIMWWQRDWTSFCLITTIPCCIFLFSGRWMIESPRWLASRHKTKRCIKELQKIAKVNKSQLPENLQSKLMINNKSERKIHTVLSIFSTPRLAKNVLILVFSMSVMSLTYVCLVISAFNLAGNPYLNFVYLGLVDLPVFLLSKYGCDRFGRRAVGLLGLLVACLGNFTMSFLIQDPSKSLSMIWVCIITKGTTAMTIKSIYLQFVELCPTCIRQTGSSLASMVSNCLGIIGPYIVALGISSNIKIPYLIYASLALVALICCVFVPDTLDQQLPDTLQDGANFGVDQDIWGRSKKRDYDGVPTKAI